jgi:hypothetical protein
MASRAVLTRCFAGPLRLSANATVEPKAGAEQIIRLSSLLFERRFRIAASWRRSRRLTFQGKTQ